MFLKHIKKLITKIHAWQEEHDREMDEWRESDPDAYYAFMMEQYHQKLYIP